MHELDRSGAWITKRASDDGAALPTFRQLLMSIEGSEQQHLRRPSGEAHTGKLLGWFVGKGD